MKKKIDVEGALERGEIGVIADYLQKNIHRYGRTKTSRQLLIQASGEDFEPDYYISYLKEKYGKLYGLKEDS